MENKMYLNDGKEVKMGDTIALESNIKHPDYGELKKMLIITLNDKNISVLKEKGIITDNNEEEDNNCPLDMEYYIEKFADKMEWKYNKAINYLNTLQDINPAIPFKILLREIALEMDSHCKGHIKDCKEVYAIDVTDGMIKKLIVKDNTHFEYFAAFRDKESAIIACTILKELMLELYGNRE